jgi:sRNA-binding carbon storage regulator CsrA
VYKARLKEGDRLCIGGVEIIVEKVGFKNVHIGAKAPPEMLIRVVKNCRQKLTNQIQSQQ